MPQGYRAWSFLWPQEAFQALGYLAQDGPQRRACALCLGRAGPGVRDLPFVFDLTGQLQKNLDSRVLRC